MDDTPTSVADVTHATRVILDVLAMRTGPTPDGGAFRMTCVPVEDAWPRWRRERAEAWAHAVPVGTAHADVPRLAARLAASMRDAPHDGR